MGEVLNLVTAPGTIRGTDVEPQTYPCRVLVFF
jgi:hypothetical protein